MNAETGIFYEHNRCSNYYIARVVQRPYEFTGGG